MKTTFLCSSLFAALTIGASAQGLLDLGSPADFKDDSPLTFTAAASLGWDDNVYASRDNEVDSLFVQGGVGARYGWTDRVTSFNVGADFSVVHYLDGDFDEVPAGFGEFDETSYNIRLSANVSHRFTPRLQVNDNFYVSYEIEPDYDIGASTNRRNGQYLYFYNNASLAYAWNRRFSTVAGYTVTAIKYDDDILADAEDRFTHQLSLQGRYLLSSRTTGLLEYRFAFTDYDRLDSDFMTHSLLAGVEHSFSSDLSGNLLAGVQYYENDRGFDEIMPYVEGALRYSLDRQTNVRIYNRLGFEASEVGAYDRRYSYRVGGSFFHQFTERLNGTAGLHYSFSDFAGVGNTIDSTEHTLNGSIGTSYRIWNNVDLRGAYTYTTVFSDEDYREFDRQRVTLGVTATF